MFVFFGPYPARYRLVETDNKCIDGACAESLNGGAGFQSSLTLLIQVPTDDRGLRRDRIRTIVHGTGHHDIWLPRVEAHCINLGDMALQDLVQAEFSNGINMNIMLNRDC